MSYDRPVTAMFWLAFIAVFAATILHWLLQLLGIELPWFIDVATPVGIYEGLFRLVDQSLWKYPIFRWIGWNKVPDLNGKWHAKFTSSHDKHESKRTAEVRIKQTWSAIHIWFDTSESSSHSEIATITTEPNGDQYLIYEYVNDPSPGKAVKAMHRHRGTCRLVINKEATILKGEYYSGRDRQNNGELELQR